MQRDTACQSGLRERAVRTGCVTAPLSADARLRRRRAQKDRDDPAGQGERALGGLIGESTFSAFEINLELHKRCGQPA